MKLSYVLPLAAAGSAFVLPTEQVLNELKIESNHRKGWLEDGASTKDDILSSSKEFFDKSYEEVAAASKSTWDHANDALSPAFEQAAEFTGSLGDQAQDAASGVRSWFESSLDDAYDVFDGGHHGHHGHHPHEPEHDHKPNLTVYQLIAGSKYTTKLAKFISEYDDLVEALNSTKANYTVFAPTDKAFDKIPEHAPKPTREQLKKFLSYHVVPEFYPAKRVLLSHTAPTLLKSDSLGSEPLPQRIAFKINLRGLTVNFYSRIVAINIFGTNGVIHGVDTPLFPPVSVIKAIDLFPGEFSTLELGLGKTGLLEKLNTTDHAGGTFFAPSNFAFQKLGPKINAFLFSQYGLKYLKALLEYHVVPDNTLYSDAFYKASSSEIESSSVPKGKFHVDLPTMLEDRNLAIDIFRFGGYISMKINGFSSVDVQDGIAEDGVIHVVSDVIVPPKKLGMEEQYWNGEEMSIEELVERLEPFVPKGDL